MLKLGITHVLVVVGDAGNDTGVYDIGHLHNTSRCLPGKQIYLTGSSWLLACS